MDLTGRAAPAFRPPRGRHDRREPPPVVAEQPLEAPGVGEAPPACSWSGLGRGAPGWPRGRGRSPRASWPHRGGARRMAPPVTYQSRSGSARPQSSSGPSSQPGSAPPRRRGRGPYWRPARRRGRELPPGWCAELPGGGAVPRARAAGPRAAAGRLAESPARGPRTPETRRARSSAPPATRPSVASSVPWGARRRPIRPVGPPGPTGPQRAAAVCTEPPPSGARGPGRRRAPTGPPGSSAGCPGLRVAPVRSLAQLSRWRTRAGSTCPPPPRRPGPVARAWASSSWPVPPRPRGREPGRVGRPARARSWTRVGAPAGGCRGRRRGRGRGVAGCSPSRGPDAGYRVGPLEPAPGGPGDLEGSNACGVPGLEDPARDHGALRRPPGRPPAGGPAGLAAPPRGARGALDRTRWAPGPRSKAWPRRVGPGSPGCRCGRRARRHWCQNRCGGVPAARTTTGVAARCRGARARARPPRVRGGTGRLGVPVTAARS